MPIIKYDFPQFTPPDAARLAREHYGLTAEARPLPSERDQNFLLAADSGANFVLKVANALEDRAMLEMQHAALAHLAARLVDVRVQRVIPTLAGESLITTPGPDGQAHLVRLVTYLPGRLLAHARPRSAELLHSLGHALGRLDLALQDFDCPAAHRELKWDLAHAAWVRGYLDYVDAPARRERVTRLIGRFETVLQARQAELPAQVIYNDANDYNVLVGEDGPRVTGVIDFGDMLHTLRVCEVAVAAAYAIMGRPDPLAAASDIVRGYHLALPLLPAELEALFPLICARLCITAVNSAYQRAVEPDNDYLGIHAQAAWDLMEQLDEIQPELAHYTFRQACGLPACPASPRVQAWLRQNAAAFHPLVRPDPATAPVTVLDLSVGSPELGTNADFEDRRVFARRITERMRAAGASTGVGRHAEARPIYAGPQFQQEGNDGPEWRTLHLGLDLFQEAGTPVFAPLAGQVHAFHDNAAPGDPGPVILLEHRPRPDITFYSLYAHLSRESLDGLQPGQPVEAGACLGRIGPLEENGGWPPHLHFQLSLDLLGLGTRFPGVVRPAEREVWLSLSPDPNLIVRIPGERFPPAQLAADEILCQRRQHLGRNLSLSYRRPLHIVRGYRQHLYDAEGRRYLDTVNNVAHVGHSHPRVVRAAQEQMAVLNTNTRYLHAGLVRYAERLCASLPEPLRVVYLVCSGSEANELALRLARAHTGSRETLVVDVAYHGNTSSLIEISPYKHAGPGGQGAPSFVHVLPMPDVYRGRHRGPDPLAGAAYAAYADEAVTRIQQRGGRVGAFIAESILSCGGQIVLPPGYLQAVYRAVRAAGGVCLADEVQVGFGRVGTHFWAFETQGVVPDIVTLGKPIGNGHPLGAVITTPEIAASFDNGMEYFNTFGGNPVSCAVGQAVLDVIESEGLQRRALEVGAHLERGLRGLLERHPPIGDVRGLGLFLGVELVLDHETRAPAGALAAQVADRMRENGILMSTDGPDHNVLKIKPPLVFDLADANFLVSTLDRVLGEDMT